MGYEGDFTAQLAAAAKLNQELGRSKAMLEVQEWASIYKEALKQAVLYESLMRLTAK